MFKDIFLTIFSLITSPGATWQKLSEREEDHHSFLNRFMYPLIGLTALAAFVGFFFGRKHFDLQLAIKETTTVLVTSFVGFFIAAFLLDEVLQRFFNKAKAPKLSQRFTGYVFSISLVVYIIMDLLPDFSFLRFAPLYTIYVIWEGAKNYMDIPENKRVAFVVAASLILFISPAVIEKAMYFLMPGIRT